MKKKGQNLVEWYASLTDEQKAAHTAKRMAARKNNGKPWHSEKCIQNMVANHKGSTGKKWKYPWDKRKFNGDDKEYYRLHNWVYKMLGKATKCEHCGKEGTGKQMNWANKSQEYKKDPSDWMQLCPHCHAVYDLNFVRQVS